MDSPVLEVGGVMLEQLIHSDGGDYRGRRLSCEQGHGYEFKEYRDKEVLTVLGRMRYAEFRKQGLFVGSGVVEAGCRTVIGQRLKFSGMHWTAKGAHRIIALRCCILRDRWEEFWEYETSR